MTRLGLQAALEVGCVVGRQRLRFRHVFLAVLQNQRNDTGGRSFSFSVGDDEVAPAGEVLPGDVLRGGPTHRTERLTQSSSFMPSLK